MFVKISQNSPGNICDEVVFLWVLEITSGQLYQRILATPPTIKVFYRPLVSAFLFETVKFFPYYQTKVKLDSRQEKQQKQQQQNKRRITFWFGICDAKSRYRSPYPLPFIVVIVSGTFCTRTISRLSSWRYIDVLELFFTSTTNIFLWKGLCNYEL